MKAYLVEVYETRYRDNNDPCVSSIGSYTIYNSKLFYANDIKHLSRILKAFKHKYNKETIKEIL